MKEQHRETTSREQLFEALYGYPIRLAEQVVAMGAIPNPKVSEEFFEFHRQRVEYVDELLTKGVYD